MIDIHSHTLYSDGSSTVKELLQEAEKTKLSLLSITDHNTVKAYEELANPNIRNIYNGEILNGIEITTTYNGEVVEVLGYGFDLKIMQDMLNKYVLSFEEEQLKEYEIIKNRYRKIGVIFDETNIKFDPKKRSCHIPLILEIKRHSENNKFFLYEESITTNFGFTRNELYNPKSPLFVDISSLYPSLKETIDIIHNAKGLAFLAHPFAYSKNIEKSLLEIIDNYEFDGLECFHTTFTKSQSHYLVKLCKEKGLFMSGGSDFHGKRKINHNLGTGNNNLNIDESIIKDWINLYISNSFKSKTRKR